MESTIEALSTRTRWRKRISDTWRDRSCFWSMKQEDQNSDFQFVPFFFSFSFLTNSVRIGLLADSRVPHALRVINNFYWYFCTNLACFLTNPAQVSFLLPDKNPPARSRMSGRIWLFGADVPDSTWPKCPIFQISVRTGVSSEGAFVGFVKI